MSLRSRLALLFGLLVLAVSVVISASAFRSTSDELASVTDTFLQQRADEVVSGLRAAPQDRRSGRNNNNSGNTNQSDGGAAGGAAVGTVTGALPFDPDSIVQSINRDGVITGSSGGDLPISMETLAAADSAPGQNTGKYSHFEDITVAGESYRMYVRALPDGGAVQVARSTTESDAVLNGLVARFVVVAVVASLLASLAGWLVARQTTKPLRRLTQVAATVADTRDFSTRVSIDRSDEIGKLAGSFQQMLTALETSREQQHRLVHDAGHELRTPLTSLRANVELLQRARNLPSDEQDEVLAAIRAELGELGNLFDELMELATDSRDDDAPMARCDLHEVVERTVERWQRRTGRTINVDASTATVMGNEAMLERALTNLLGNANKFSPPGSPIDVVAAGGSVAVRDQGPGVPPAERERIFDRFYRSDLTRSMPGSGLGLAIVAQIVERHGGTAWAAEAPSGGAEIGFRLPLLTDQR